jgi:HSP20 family protein
MFTRFRDLERTFSAMDEARRRMDRLFDEYHDDGGWLRGALVDDTGSPFGFRTRAAWPSVNLFDKQTALVLTAEVPGLSEKDVHIAINQDVLSLSGERKQDAPANYAVHRQERLPVKFSRSFKLPCKVDLENVTASIKDGILTITLPKVPEAQPRQITVSAQ